MAYHSFYIVTWSTCCSQNIHLNSSSSSTWWLSTTFSKSHLRSSATTTPSCSSMLSSLLLSCFNCLVLMRKVLWSDFIWSLFCGVLKNLVLVYTDGTADLFQSLENNDRRVLWNPSHGAQRLPKTSSSHLTCRMVALCFSPLTITQNDWSK